MFCCSRKPQGGPPESVAAINFFINVYIQYLIVLYVVALYLYRPLNFLVLTEKSYNFKVRFLFQKGQWKQCFSLY